MPTENFGRMESALDILFLGSVQEKIPTRMRNVKIIVIIQILERFQNFLFVWGRGDFDTKR